MFSKENKNLVNKNWTKKWSLFSKLLLNSPGRILNYKFVDFTKILFFYLISPFLSLFEAGLTQLPSSPLHAPYRELQSQTMLHLSLTLTLSLSLLQYICVSLKQHIVNWLTKKFVSLQGFQKSSIKKILQSFLTLLSCIWKHLEQTGSLSSLTKLNWRFLVTLFSNKK